MKSDSENQIKSNLIQTDDIAFSAYLKMKGFKIIDLHQNKSKSIFVFDIGKIDKATLKMHFINSEFLDFYNEIRSLKKLISQEV